MSAAKRKEVLDTLLKLPYGDLFAAPSLNSDNNLIFKLKAGKKEGDDFIDLGKGEPLAIVNKIVAAAAPPGSPAAPTAAVSTLVPTGTLPVAKLDLPKPNIKESSGDWRSESTDSWRDKSTGSDDGGDLHSEWARAESEAETKWQENAELVRDISNHRGLLGESSVNVKPMGALELVNVELLINLRDVIDENIGTAWGVDVKVPLVVSLSFSFYYVDSTTTPKLELYQVRGAQKDKTFKLRSQLTSIITTFVGHQWPLWTGSSAKRPPVHIYGQKSALPPAENKSKGAAKSDPKAEKPGLLGRLMGSSSKEPAKVDNTVMDGPFKKPVASPSSPPGGKAAVSQRDSELAQLSEMGFTIEVATAALNATKTFDEALALLLAGGSDTAGVVAHAPSSGSGGIGMPKPVASKFIDELAKASAHEHKYIAEYGFLVAIHSYLKGRVPTLSNYCVICDQPHVFGNMLKPAVCTRELCCWSFQQLGVGAGSADEIATAAEVVDLLVSFACSAANSARKETIFEPYPTIMDPKDPKKALMSPQTKDFVKLCEVLNKMPSIEKIANAKDAGDMKSILDKSHPMANDMLTWIISSNRSHIVKIPKEKHVKSMNTPHQYLLMSAPPEKEAKFRDLKAKHGSVFAFHGSSTENWHCILRVGLKNASGTKLQVNGAAYGAGIYLSPAAAVSFGYSRMYGGGARPNAASSSSNRFLVSSSVHCIAICEVINTNDIKKSGDIWVQPHEDHVLTRFFFVYLTPDPGNATQNHCTKKEFETELRAAMEAYG